MIEEMVERALNEARKAIDELQQEQEPLLLQNISSFAFLFFAQIPELRLEILNLSLFIYSQNQKHSVKASSLSCK